MVIIAKTTSGRFITDSGLNLKTRGDYLSDLADNNRISEPSQAELIELGKTIHPFYKKEIVANIIQNTISEIDAYEKNKYKIIIVG